MRLNWLLLVGCLLFDHAAFHDVVTSALFSALLRRCVVFLGSVVLIFVATSSSLGGSRLLDPLLVLVLADELAQDANIVALVLEKVESVHPTEPQLQQIVVEGLLGDAHKLGGVFEGVAHRLAIAQLNSVVELAPEGDSLDHEADLPFLRALQICGIK